MKKMNKTWKRVTAIGAVMGIAAVILISQAAAIFATDSIYVNEDYDTVGSETAWERTGNGTVTRQNEENGNGFVQFDYTNPSGNAPTYYEFGHKFGNKFSSGTVVCDANIQFSNTDEGVYVKARDSNVNIIAGRLRNIGGILYYYTNGNKNNLREPDSPNWTRVNANEWYQIKFVFQMAEKTYSIYVRNMEGNVIGEVRNIAFHADVDYINLFSVGASSTMKVDECKVYVPEVTELTIIGDPYVKGGAYGNKYYAYQISKQGMFVDRIDAQWSLEKETEGVSVGKTGDLTVTSATKPCSVLLIAADPNRPECKMKYCVDIER